MKEHGALPASYAKNYKRGLDRFLCFHLGIEPAAVEKSSTTASMPARTTRSVTAGCSQLFPKDVQRGEMEPRAGAERHDGRRPRFHERWRLKAMGCADRVDEIKSVPDLIDFDEGRIE